MKSGAMVLVAACVLVGGSAWAWDPSTDEAVTITAAHLLTKEGTAQLAKLDAEIRQGASASAEAYAYAFPGLATGEVRAIESEMYLLSSVRGRALDPYFAYRLGMLGKLVARITAPLADEGDSPYPRLYYQDVAANIRNVPLKVAPRRAVDPATDFSRLRSEANSRKDMIMRDYQDGIGFQGLAKAALSEDYSRSVNAVADVWFTILAGSAVRASVSQDQLQRYIIGAMQFYVQRGNLAEIDSNYRRLITLTPETPEMARRIGDMFYEGGFYERAIKEYQIVLRAEPGRRDVVERIAEYYMRVGDESLEGGRLKEALDAFSQALSADPLHPQAEARRLEVEGLIAARDARLEAVRRLIEQAAEFEATGEQYALRNQYSDAIEALRQAKETYQKVDNEFPTEFQAASAGLANVDARLNQMKSQMIQSAQAFSGAGASFEVRRLAAGAAESLDGNALRKIRAAQLEERLGQLKTQYREKAQLNQ